MLSDEYSLFTWRTAARLRMSEASIAFLKEEEKQDLPGMFVTNAVMFGKTLLKKEPDRFINYEKISPQFPRTSKRAGCFLQRIFT